MRFGSDEVAPSVDGIIEDLRLLAAVTGGTAAVFGWSGDSVASEYRCDPPPQPLTIPPFDCGALMPGTEAPLHVLLAWLSPAVLDRRVAALARTSSIARNRATLALRLARVRTSGFDVSSGGVRGEVTSLAVPVRDARATVTDALALITPSVYLEDLDLPTITATLSRLAAGLTTAHAFSERAGRGARTDGDEDGERPLSAAQPATNPPGV